MNRNTLLPQLIKQACSQSIIVGDLPLKKVNGITSDSRKIQKDFLFVAYKGTKVDGHSFVNQAFKQGAIAAIVQKKIPVDGPIIIVQDTRRSMATLQREFWGNPQQYLTLIGITGTNGKTTTTYLLEAIFKHFGKETGIIGTVEARYNGIKEKSLFTTPDPEYLFPLLYKMSQSGVNTVIMEVSSHALALERVYGLKFKGALLTNFTQDHLDFHKTMEEYANSKSLLFTKYLEGEAVAWAKTQKLWDIIPKELNPLLYDLKKQQGINIFPDWFELDINGIQGQINNIPFTSPLIGAHNVLNILGAVGISSIFNIPAKIALNAIKNITVPGRLERVQGPVPVFVDYAHTPDALIRAQNALKPLVKGRLITVFGAGGDRDNKKRPIMGKAVYDLSDVIVVTSDNPRTEDPIKIIKEILNGIPEKHNKINMLNKNFKGVVIEPDREQAIGHAILNATPKDAVLIAGKGHEDYQIIGTQKIHFDDREIASYYLKDWRKNNKNI